MLAKNSIQTGIKNGGHIQIIDIVPTIASILGFKDQLQDIDGIDLFESSYGSPPSIVSKSPAEDSISLQVNSEQAFAVTSNDPDGDSINCKWYLDGYIKSINSSSWSFIPDNTNIGNRIVTVSCTDGRFQSVRKWKVYVYPQEIIVPVINQISDHSTVEGPLYTGQTPSLSQGTQPVTWSLVSGPSGMTINSSTGVVSWPNPTVTGSPHTITIRATNSAGSDDESWLLTVTQNIIAPIINPISDHSTSEGSAYTGPTPSLLQGTQPVTWSLINPPSGMTINSSTGVVSWPNPTVTGSPHTITIRATNDAGSDDESWLLTVNSCSYTIVPEQQVFGIAGGSDTVNITTQDGCNWTAVSNDAWITITSSNSGTGSGSIDYSVDVNSSGVQRIGTINIAGHIFTVTQAGIPQYDLIVTKTGTGSGTISGNGIYCGNDCTETLNENTEVTLSVIPNACSTFVGWSGDCTGTGECILTMDGNKNVQAEFSTSLPPLTLSVMVFGQGNVTSSQPGIDCGSDCTEVFNCGETETLVALPSNGWIFRGWNGACWGTGECNLNIDRDSTVTAIFELDPASPDNFAIGGSTTLNSDPFSEVTFAGQNSYCSKSDENGQYSCTVMNDWTGNIIPSKSLFTFNPDFRSYLNISSNQSNQYYAATATSGTVMSFDDFDIMASLQSDGQYNMVGFNYWNSQPLTETNRPNYDQRRLQATMNLYVDPIKTNELYIEIADVTTTIGASWSGTSFENVSQAGILINLPGINGENLLNKIIGFSSNYAIPDQTRIFDGGSEIIYDTPGYQLELIGSQIFVHTIQDVYNAFVSFVGLWGPTSRIRGGGVFKLTFDPSVNLKQAVDWDDVAISSMYGRSNQYIEGVHNNAIYSIIGKVQAPDGTPIEGFIINLSDDATASTVTDSLGIYRFSSLANGNYIVRPNLDYVFLPNERIVTIADSIMRDQDFTATDIDTDIDTDGDGVPDYQDNCIDVENPDQADSDGDGIGDVCDLPGSISGTVTDEATGNGVSGAWVSTNGPTWAGVYTDESGNYTLTGLNNGDYRVQVSTSGYMWEYYDNTQDWSLATIITVDPGENIADINFALSSDRDNDGIRDTADNCPDVYNGDQTDRDGDGTGDACDPDIDGDGIANEADNCPLTDNPDQVDTDDDGFGDVCTVVHCVSTSAELQAALNTAQWNGMNDVIQLVQGTYGISGNSNTRFYYGSSESYSLAIRGGYTTGCSTRELNPTNTVLDGEEIDTGSWAGVLYLENWWSLSYADFIVEGVTIQNGKSYYDGGLYVHNSYGKVTLTNNIIKGNAATNYAGAYIGSSYGNIVLTNNVVTGNTASNYGGGVYAYSYQGKVDIVNNTITGNSTTVDGGAAGGL